MSEPYDADVLIAQRDAWKAQAIAAQKVSQKLCEDARLLLEPVLHLPAGTFVARPHLFRVVFGGLLDAMRPALSSEAASQPSAPPESPSQGGEG